MKSAGNAFLECQHTEAGFAPALQLLQENANACAGIQMKADVLKEFDVVHISNPIATTRALNGRRRRLYTSSILFMHLSSPSTIFSITIIIDGQKRYFDFLAKGTVSFLATYRLLVYVLVGFSLPSLLTIPLGGGSNI